MVICLMRTQALVNFEDQYCVDCWEEDVLEDLGVPYYNRRACFDENVVSEEEFIKLYPYTK